MNPRLEQLAKWTLLIALIVLIGASTFNKQTIVGENKMGLADLSVGTAYSGSTINNRTGVGSIALPITTAPTTMAPAQYLDYSGNYTNVNPDVPAGPTAQELADAQVKAQAREQFNTQRNLYNTSVTNAVDQAAKNYQRTLQDTISGWNQTQQGLDTRRVNNEMAKSQGLGGIMQMVGQGIRSAGTMLGNRNAGSSSASQAIASAYGKLGQQQATKVGNQYELANTQLGTDQATLDAARALQQSRWSEDKTSVVNGIITDAQRQIDALNNAAANASISDRIDMAAEAERIKQEATAQLQQYDAELAKINQAQSAEQARSRATQLAAAGTPNPVQFQYSTEVPGQFQNTGPFSSELPIFTYGSNKNKQLG